MVRYIWLNHGSQRLKYEMSFFESCASTLLFQDYLVFYWTDNAGKTPFSYMGHELDP